MFKAAIGDLFASDAQTLVNTVNCVGVMGKGVAAAFKSKFPQMFEDYVARCDQGLVRLGEPYLYRDLGGLMIINFPTKNHWRSPSRLEDIEQGLDYLARHFQEWGVTSLAMPPLGCGNGGLVWSDVGPLIYAKLAHLPLDVEVYAPFGTLRTELSETFLAAPRQMSFDTKGRSIEKMNPEWPVLLEVLAELEEFPFSYPVGRVIFQKICYVLTELGVDTGFRFEKGSFGPFADDVKRALHEFANRNWVQEKQLGPMMSLKIGPQYRAERSKYADVIKKHERKIAKTVDLFSRMKNTDQAEVVATVLFASRKVKQARPGQEVSEQELMDYILDWKKHWGKNPESKQAVANAIRNLVVLGWMKLKFSESLQAEV